MLARSSIRSSVVRHFVAVAVLAFLSTAMAHADSLSYSNFDGTVLLGSNGALSLSSSEITAINGISQAGPPYSDHLSFTTSSSFTGNLQQSGSWAAGGTITIRGTSGIIFSGTFSGPVDWSLEAGTVNSGCQATSGGCFYQLSGSITGFYCASGATVCNSTDGVAILSGAEQQLTLTTKSTGYYTGKNTLSDKGGTTSFLTPTPEPGSLVLMGTGLIGAGFFTRRKVKGTV